MVISTVGLTLGLVAAGLVLGAPAAATPGGPCEEVVYVGTCDPVGSPQVPTGPSHPYGEQVVLPSAAPNAIG